MGTKSNVKEVSVKSVSKFDIGRKVICWMLILLTIVGIGFITLMEDVYNQRNNFYNMQSSYFRQLEVYKKLESFEFDIASDVLIAAYKKNPTEYIANLNKNKSLMVKESKEELEALEIKFIKDLEEAYKNLLTGEELKVLEQKQQAVEYTEKTKYDLIKASIVDDNKFLKEIFEDDKEKIKALNNINESMKKSFEVQKKPFDITINGLEKIYETALEVVNKEGNIPKKSKVGYHLAKNNEDILVFKDDIYTNNSAQYVGVFFNNFMTEGGPFKAYGPVIGDEISSGIYFKDVINALEMVGYDMNSKYTLSLSADEKLLTTGEFEKLYADHVAYRNSQSVNYEGELEVIFVILGIGFLIGLLLYKTILFRVYRKIPLGFIVGPSAISIYLLSGQVHYYLYVNIIVALALTLIISDLRFISKFGLSARFESEKKIFFNKWTKKVTKGSINTIVSNAKKIDVTKIKNIDFKKVDFDKVIKFYRQNEDKINYALIFPLGFIIFMTSIFLLNFYSILVLFGGGILIVIFVIGYILILCKNARLKKEIREIELATKKIVEGDFDISFNEGKISSLDNIRENLVGIDKGFKIAIQDELKSEKMKAELITNVSHDLKTPLTSIISYVDLLQKEGIAEDEKKAYIKILDHKSKRLKVLIEDLFEASKAATGNIKLNIETIDVNSVLRQTIAEFKEKIDEAHLDFKITMPEHKVFLQLDGARTWRIFENLIGNALKYSMDRTRVYVDLFDYEDKVVFEIKNISGYELNCSPDELKERFKRADESRNTEGSGLGLAIANSLTELQGGRLDISIDGDLFKVRITFEK